MYVTLTKLERFLLVKLVTKFGSETFSYKSIENYWNMSPKVYKPIMKRFRDFDFVNIVHYWNEDDYYVCGSGHCCTDFADKYVYDLLDRGYDPDAINFISDKVMSDLSTPLPTFSEKRQ